MKRNGFCYLTDNLPDRICIKDKSVALDTKTSSAIAVLLFINDPNRNDYEKTEYIVTKLIKETREQGLTYNQTLELLNTDDDTLASILLSYLRGAPKVKSYKQLNDNENTQNNGEFAKNNKLPCFDFIQDSDAILSAFRQSYGLSLQETKNLHYWEFLALLNNIPEGTVFSTIKQIRTMKIDPKASPERKQEIREAQRSVALVDTRTPEQKKADFQSQINSLEL